MRPEAAIGADGANEQAGGGASHWAFQPLRRPEVPVTRNAAWGRNSVDAFILARMEAAGVAPAPRADKRMLLRRAAFDLTGLPPTPEEARSFLEDSTEGAFGRLVDRLLNSPHYGEHWGRHWLDVVRYADTAGETADYPVPVAWRYRNYVIEAFNADKPYNEFLEEQIAGDILAGQGPRERYAERVTATGYLALSRRFGFDSENYHQLTIQDTIDTLGQSVLGISLGCARCHDHKYDPVSIADYYALYGIFDSTRYAFPGSEQKQKYRSMAPLLPPEEAKSEWRDFDERIAGLIRKLDRNKQSPPPAVLRSLADMDGDFEMQAIAAGGSKGVLVPPWVYEGGIAVTREAQSPYGNLYPLGRVGASLPSGTNDYELGQALYPRRTHEEGGKVFVNVDFRLGTNAVPGDRGHRLWIGSRPGGSPAQARAGGGIAVALELAISGDGIGLAGSEGGVEPVWDLVPGKWHNLRLVLDLGKRIFDGELSLPGEVRKVSGRPLRSLWNGVLDYFGMQSEARGGARLPGLEVDNIGARDGRILTLSESLAGEGQGEPALPELVERLRVLSGLDGDFELQTDNAAPSAPWHPGPNSAARISGTAQSSFRNIHGEGRLGIHLPAGGAYNGFGQTLTSAWKAEGTERLHVSFDFRIRGESSAEGSWRYYLGHGAGPSPALEFYLNGREFFVRDGEAKIAVRPLEADKWYQVQATLDLKGRRFAGWIGSPEGRTAFGGATPSVWDGTIDYTFVDSYGHLAGVKPGLDVDNMAVNETALPGVFDVVQASDEEAIAKKRRDAEELRRRMEGVKQEIETTRKELQAALGMGPSDLAYAVMEGTPRNARVHLRGEQDRLGPEVARGFIGVLGGDRLPEDARGSGRLELARWITRAENPLTARVMVNRIWQYHFGRGLVKTPNDFGARGQAPTHPELLDYLAARFMEAGWSIKAMHRLIMNSDVYQMASSSGEAQGGEEDLYASFPRRRLSAEALRDAVLLVSGDLDRTPGRGHPFPAPTTWGFSQHGPFSAVYEHNKRSVYLMTQRIKRHPFLALFDGPDPNASTPVRSVSTVPTQALYFLNDPFIHEKAGKFAARIERGAASETERIRMAYEWALGRPPEELETEEAREFLAGYREELQSAGTALPEAEAGREALTAFARALFGGNEFLHVD